VISLSTARRLASERTARAAAESALQRQNEFIATLAGDLEALLPTLAGRLEQARALTSEPVLSGSAPVGSAQSTSRPLQDEQPSTARFSPTSPRLSRREAEVLGLLAQGLSNKEIAGVMWLSDRTVERHISSLYRKIGVARRSEATAFALRHGLSEPSVEHP
jgi:DNA-binding NarL/FixJ family response regulator